LRIRLTISGNPGSDGKFRLLALATQSNRKCLIVTDWLVQFNEHPSPTSGCRPPVALASLRLILASHGPVPSNRKWIWSILHNRWSLARFGRNSDNRPAMSRGSARCGGISANAAAGAARTGIST